MYFLERKLLFSLKFHQNIFPMVWFIQSHYLNQCRPNFLVHHQALMSWDTLTKNPVYPILSGDSRFWLIINHVGYTRASHFDGFVQDCSNSFTKALELLQSCTKPLIWCIQYDISSWCLWWHHNDELLQSCTKPLIWCIQYNISSWCLWWHHNCDCDSSLLAVTLWYDRVRISRQKIPIFVFAAHVSNCKINYRHTLTHRHTWFDQGQLTIQLILLVIELIQEVKTTLVNLIKMRNRFSY